MQSTEITNEIGNGPSLQIEEPIQLTVSDVSLDFFPFSNTVLWGLHGLASDAIL